MTTQPDILLILNDDMGYSDIGCFGGEVQTPNLDRLANHGLRFSQFYNTARCSPSRASLLTGLHPHQTGIGILTDDYSPEGYSGNLNKQCMTIAEVLRAGGYSTYMSGKWHLSSSYFSPTDAWPMQRGFDSYYGTTIGCGSFFDPTTLTRGNDNIEHEAREPGFFYTDAINDNAVNFIRQHHAQHGAKPYFQYVAHTAPHWPLHAKDEDIAKYKGRFDAGWDTLREERLARLVKAGILNEQWQLSDRDPTQPPWTEVERKEWMLRRMEVYAAQIDCMDQGIGRIIQALEDTGRLDNTLIIFLSDNGACAENLPKDMTVEELVDTIRIGRAHTRTGEPVRIGNQPDIMPGPEDTYQSYGTGWANLSNAPFRMYKHWVHEGGISTPLIFHWPNGINAKGGIRHTPGYLPDIMATVLDVTGVSYPTHWNGQAIQPVEGHSLTQAFEHDLEARPPMFWEHEGNSAARMGRWKLVRKHPGPWELYDLVADRTELNDLAKTYPDRVQDMAAQYEIWAARCCVIPRDQVVASMLKVNEHAMDQFWERE